MSQNEYMILTVIGGMLLAVIAFFIKSALNKLEIKADKEALEAAVDTLRKEQAAAEERFRREADKMERQYDVKFSGVVSDFQDKLKGMESNLSKQIEMVLLMLSNQNNRG
jgi:Na+-translocating ferredoxin:NAD+ oxidoreductase RnfG subunit